MKETKFKQTDIGRIPEDWEVKALGDIGDTYSGLTGKCKQDFIKGSSYYITFLNVLNNPILKPELFESVQVDIDERQNRAHKGDLFFNTSSETPEEVGICALLDNEIDDLYLNSFCFGYRLKDNNVTPLFLSYFFRSKEGRQLMTIAAQGVTRYNLSKSTFNKIRLALPPLAEQERIASALTAVDNLIASLDKQIAKTRNLKQATMQHLLSSLPNHSPLKPLGEVAEMRRGIVMSKDFIRNNPGIYPVYSSQTENNGEFGKISTYMYDGEFVTWTTDGEHAGSVFYRTGKFNITNICGLLKVKNETELIAKFLYYALLMTAKSYVNREVGNPKLMSNVMATVSVPLPPIEEQKRIASILTAMDNQIAALEKKRSKYEMVKQGMMQQLLTGTIRLT